MQLQRQGILVFNYRVATEAERKLPVEHLKCGYLCGEYLLCVMGYDGPVEYWSAAKLSNGVLEFVKGVENCDDAMECAIKLHEVLLAAGIVGDTGTTVAANGSVWRGDLNYVRIK